MRMTSLAAQVFFMTAVFLPSYASPFQTSTFRPEKQSFLNLILLCEYFISKIYLKTPYSKNK
jgi:hypothetical protein